MMLDLPTLSAPPKTKMEIYGNPCVFNDSGASHDFRSSKETMQMYGYVFNDIRALHQRNNENVQMMLELPMHSAPQNK